MGSHELSPDLQERLKEALGSYEELQLLLYARGQPGPWSLQDASRRLHLDEGALTEALDCLLAAGFLWTVEDGGPEKRFTYRPSSPALAELTERLAETIDGDPLYVFELMNRHALERLRTSAARTFASAFVLGRKKDG